MQVKQKNAIVIVLAVLLVAFVWYQFVYASAESAARKANQEARDQQTNLATLKSEVSKASGANKTPEERKAALDELQSAIPVQAQLSEFLRQTDSIRNATGVAFQSITPSTPTYVGGVANINVGITVQGTYAQVMGYVDRLLKLPRLVVVDNVAVTTTTAQSAGSGVAGATTGGPVGDVFAGQGSPPFLQVQLTGRLFAVAPDGYMPTAPVGGSAPGNGASGSTGTSH